MPLHIILLFSLLCMASAQYTCNTVMPYSNMQYLTQSQRTLYNLTNPCSFTCLPNYFGDYCAPVPTTPAVPKGPWNVAGYYASGTGVLQTMTLSLLNTLSQICFTSMDNLLIGISNRQQYDSAIILISLSTRQQNQIAFSAPTGYLDAIQVRYGQVFVARATALEGPYQISILTGPLQAGPYSFTAFMPIPVRASIIEVFLDKGMNTTFVYSTRNNNNTLYACYPNGVCNAWASLSGITGIVCGMDCQSAVYISVSNTIRKVTSTGVMTTLPILGQPTVINCITSIPLLNTILFRTNMEVQQLSLGSSQSVSYTSVLTLSTVSQSCSFGQCCSLDASDSATVIMLAENGVIRTVEAQQQQCGYGQTSLSIVSTPNASTCFACPPVPSNAFLIANDPLCTWQCSQGYYQSGSQCVALPNAPCPLYFNQLSWGQCLPSTMPWAPSGSYLVAANTAISSSTMYTIPLPTDPQITHYPPFILAAGSGLSFLGMSNNLYVAANYSNKWQLLSQPTPTVFTNPCSYSMNNNFYYLAQQGQYLWVAFSLLGADVTHCLWALNVSTAINTKGATPGATQAYRWTLGSTACSVTSDQGGNVFVLLCGANYILKSQYAPALNSGFSVLSGQTKAGYLDGQLQAALFNAPTSIAFYNQRLYVTDTNNCVIRELDILRNMASTVAGQTGVCQRQDGSPSGLRSPTTLSLSAFDGFFLFKEQGQEERTITVRQFHVETGHVSTLGVSPILDASTLLGFADRVRVLSNKTGQFYDITASTLPCPAGMVSLDGNAMSLSGCLECGIGYYSNLTRCQQCSVVSCSTAGQRPVACGPDFDSYCGKCSNLPTDSAAVYTGPAQSYDGWTNCPWVYLPPCPVGFFKNQSTCLSCPAWSTTAQANAMDISSCSCTSGHWATDAQGTTLYTCVIPSPYLSMPEPCQQLSNCQAFSQPAFPFPTISTCTSAAVDSIYGVCACQPGEFIAQIYPKRCEACPKHLYSPTGQSCERCPPYAEPSLDGSTCRCAGGSLDVAISTQALQCVCGPGRGFNPQMGCYICPDGFYGPNTLTLSSTPWLQSQECIQCPAGYWSAQGQTQCVKCPLGTYREQGMQGCAECPAGMYAPDPYTATCTVCQEGCNGLLQTPCPTDASLFICSECPPKRSNADFNGADNCATSCWNGYYEKDLNCVQCTAFNSTTCPQGNRLEQCGAYNDASCLPCTNASMPLYNAVWVSGNPDPLGPSLSCTWKCADGYTAREIAWKGTPYTVWSCDQTRAWSLLDMFSF